MLQIGLRDIESDLLTVSKILIETCCEKSFKSVLEILAKRLLTP
jgi:hypothetical protein